MSGMSKTFWIRRQRTRSVKVRTALSRLCPAEQTDSGQLFLQKFEQDPDSRQNRDRKNQDRQTSDSIFYEIPDSGQNRDRQNPDRQTPDRKSGQQTDTGSCSTTINGEFYIFGGMTRRRQVSKIMDCSLKRVGDLPYELHFSACGTFQFPEERSMICFAFEHAKSCVR